VGAGISFAIQKELTLYVEKHLPRVVGRVFRTYRQAGHPVMSQVVANYAELHEYLYTLRDTDEELRELCRKRTILYFGAKAADQIEARLRTYRLSAPQWLKARDAILSGFRGGVPMSDAVALLPGSIQC